MFRRCTLVLALVSALTGCVAAPPKGAFVEYHEGLTPITHRVRCEATYALRVTDQTGFIATCPAKEGDRIGFRRESDGSVSAVTTKQVIPLAPSAYVWEVMPGLVPPWSKRAKQELRLTVAVVASALGLATLFGLSTLANGDDDSTWKPGSGEPNGVIIPAHRHDSKP